MKKKLRRRETYRESIIAIEEERERERSREEKKGRGKRERERGYREATAIQ